jgi:hypothetical protein
MVHSRRRKGAAAPLKSEFAREQGEGAVGLHLYRCWQCKRVLLKPLQCANCMLVAYCSKECQLAHWQTHKAWCREGRKKPSRVRQPNLPDKLGQA